MVDSKPPNTSTLYNIVNDHDKHRSAFFWTPGGSAAQRRAAEFARNLRWSEGGHDYEVTQTYSESCKKCYYSLDIRCNGIKRDNRIIKKLIKSREETA
jgi:hypothetical protein